MIPYLRIKDLKNPTLSHGTYLYSLYMEVPHTMAYNVDANRTVCRPV